MRARLLCSLVIAAAATILAQTSAAPVIRSVKINLVPASSEPAAPIPFAVVTKALKSSGLNVAVENRLNTRELGKADDVIKSVYDDAGLNVRVEHSVVALSPRTVEVAFDVIEICNRR